MDEGFAGREFARASDQLRNGDFRRYPNTNAQLILNCGGVIARQRVDWLCAADGLTSLSCPEDIDVVLSTCRSVHPAALIAHRYFLQAQSRSSILQLTSEESGMCLLAVLERDDDAVVTEMLLLGCRGALCAPFSRARLRQALRAMLNGELWASRKVSSALIVELVRSEVARTKYGLTARENDVLDLAAQGYKNAQIAASLFISHETVRWHKRRLYRKIRAEGANKS